MAVIVCEKAATISPNPKKKAKLDRNSVKQILDETVIEIVKSYGYVKESRESISKLKEGTIFKAIAFLAHFFIEKLPVELNRFVLFVAYSVHACRRLAGYFMEKNVFLFTYPLTGCRNTTGLALSSKLARSSSMYTLTIASANPKSAWTKPPLKLTKNFTEWFGIDGVLMEDLFRKDVVGLMNAYAEEPHESNWDCFRKMLISTLWESFLVFGMLGLGKMIYL